MPELAACVTSEAATSQPTGDCSTCTCACACGGRPPPGEAAPSSVITPNVLASSRLAAARSACFRVGAGDQQETACACPPVKSAASPAAVCSYWMYAVPSALFCTACAAWYTGSLRETCTVARTPEN